MCKSLVTFFFFFFNFFIFLPTPSPKARCHDRLPSYTGWGFGNSCRHPDAWHRPFRKGCRSDIHCTIKRGYLVKEPLGAFAFRNQACFDSARHADVPGSFTKYPRFMTPFLFTSFTHPPCGRRKPATSTDLAEEQQG